MKLRKLGRVGVVMLALVGVVAIVIWVEELVAELATPAPYTFERLVAAAKDAESGIHPKPYNTLSGCAAIENSAFLEARAKINHHDFCLVMDLCARVLGLIAIGGFYEGGAGRDVSALEAKYKKHWSQHGCIWWRGAQPRKW